MQRTLYATGIALAVCTGNAQAARIIPDEVPATLEIPVTPFANMESGYQATNPGFIAMLKDTDGHVLASGPMTMDAVVQGYSDDADQGTAYGRLVLSVSLAYTGDQLPSDGADRHGRLSICMEKATSPHTCQDMEREGRPDRPFQWIEKDVDYEVKAGVVRITRYYGGTGEGGTSHQISLALYHPAFAFAAPGKAFKDFQSPLVLDLSETNAYDLTDVWDDAHPVSFDLRGDGRVLRTGWIGPGAGLLAYLPMGGCVTSGRELFGEYTHFGAAPGFTGRAYTDGFAALAALDANGDGIIDARDPGFTNLRVWRDRAGDGICRPEDLATLGELGITSISLAHHPLPPKSVLVAGNEVRLAGTFSTTDGKAHGIADVWFKERPFAGLTTAEKRAAQRGSAQPAPLPKDHSYEMEVSNRRPVASVSDFAGATSYAASNVYLNDQLKAGMKVLFSASYGIGGEAGQSRGVLVEKDGGLYYKQQDNVTNQLLLPPGLALNDDTDVSRWELRSYVALANRVALANGTDTYDGAGGTYGRIGANLVDFKAGTAGSSLAYQDALELALTRRNIDGGAAEVRLYYAKGVGLVALEFTEETEPSGTFKVYFGDTGSDR